MKQKIDQRLQKSIKTLMFYEKEFASLGHLEQKEFLPMSTLHYGDPQ